MFDVRYTSDIVLLIWMGIVMVFAKDAQKEKVTVLGKEEERYGLLFAVIVFFPLFWFVTTVYARSDMYAYWSGYENFSMSVSDVITNWNAIDKGPGFSLVQAIARSIGLHSFQQFRVFITLLYSIPLVLVYWKYSEDYVFSVFLYVATMSYDSWMMNAMRQYLAAMMIFAAVPLLVRKKYILTLLVILAAMTVHSSAIVMIPVLLISQLKPWGKPAIFSFIAFAVVLYFYIGHSDWMSEESLEQASGSNPLRIIFSAIPAIIAFAGRRKIAQMNDRLINTCINISVITVMMYTVASVTSGIMTGRLPGYTSAFNFILLPFLLNRVFNEKISQNLKTLVTAYYSVYFILDLYFI